jgi:hypothetical protein
MHAQMKAIRPERRRAAPVQMSEITFKMTIKLLILNGI